MTVQDMDHLALDYKLEVLIIPMLAQNLVSELSCFKTCKLDICSATVQLTTFEPQCGPMHAHISGVIV